MSDSKHTGKNYRISPTNDRCVQEKLSGQWTTIAYTSSGWPIKDGEPEANAVSFAKAPLLPEAHRLLDIVRILLQNPTGPMKITLHEVEDWVFTYEGKK